ncbi:flagellar basal body P-ring protein FlgI [Limnohabitans sp. MMS-10A-178]|jgi:flagellar P-ring protein precursor FlgI|uniref:flagellar basal body P-ring protein FlgI n=1 Tax=Limnohabitans sp. MMS-10A-178 TaxID=1835767 RepID=UPI000D37518D|nr:flagellar basal body P-ring protein FlgI [Limnohabitans sp. MMS-10A-178]PUE16520.1 flagellar biosynthesis protein FlgI [Limnohabitans sp. MMS-10A-178]
MNKIFKSWSVLALLLGLSCTNAMADRIKDLTTVAAMRTNQLIGYGLVVGLQGTGDGSDVAFTAQSMKTLLNRLGVRLEGPLSDFETVASAGKVDIRNVAAVMVTAELPGFAKPGQKIDVSVSAIGRASNLRGGTLLLSSLRGVDGEIYALAQGSLTATGIDAQAAGSKVAIGVPTSARIPSGATVERIVDNPFDKADRIVLNVRESDFTTTNAIVNAINSRFGNDVARALDGVSITLQAPVDLTQRVAFMSMVENIDVMPGEPTARVVINAKTGTVVISRNVRVTAAAVTHGTISVSIAATNEISQPGAFSQGQTAAVQNAEVSVSEPNKPMFLFQPGVDLRQIVDAVNQVGASPSSLIAILEALKSSGSLRAELIVI